MIEWLPRLVARVPLTIYGKLFAAFLAIVVLLIVVGAVGLQSLRGVNQRAEDLVTLHRKIAAYRQLQHDTTGQLYSVASSLSASDERSLEATLRQLNSSATTWTACSSWPKTRRNFFRASATITSSSSGS